MTTLQIAPLADRAELVQTVASWHWNEWGHVDPFGSLRSWTEGLGKRTNLDRIPAVYVAITDGEPVGSVVLVEHDMPDREDLAHLSPWLAGLFVLPDHRRQGVGSTLVRHAQSEALRFGVHRLHAHTSTAVDLYQEVGWETIAKTEYEGSDVTILSKKLAEVGKASSA